MSLSRLPFRAGRPHGFALLEAVVALARRPNSDEVRTCGNYLVKMGNRKEAFEDILWALINSTEFLSRR